MTPLPRLINATMEQSLPHANPKYLTSTQGHGIPLLSARKRQGAGPPQSVMGQRPSTEEFPLKKMNFFSAWVLTGMGSL
jgi:hypothetical protein